MSSPSVLRTRESAPVCEKTSRKHCEIKPERGSEAFGESGGVAIIEVPEGTPRTSQLSFRCFTSNTP